MSATWVLARAYLRPHLHRLVLLGLLVAGATGLQLVGPFILGRFVDGATRLAPLTALLALAGAYTVAAVLQQLAGLAESYLATDLAMRSTNRLRQDLFEHALRLGLDFHQSTPPGALIERIDGDPTLLENVFSRMAATLVANGLLVLGTMALLLVLDWRVGLVLVVAAAAATAVRLRFTGIVTRAWVRARQVTAELTGTLEELLGALEDIAGSGAGVHAERRVQARNRDVVERTLRAILLDSAVGGSQSLFELGTTAALAMALLLYDRGRLTIGDVFMVATYGKLCLTPLMVLARQVQDLLPAGASAARGRELLSTVPSISEVSEPRSLPAGALAVELRSVGFGYGDGEAALADIDIDLPAGAVLGVLGRTGSGKTTLARLLVRLHDPRHGSVRIGGVDLREVGFDQLRRRVAYVPQETQLLDDTVRTNLTLAVDGVAQAGDGELLAALDALGLRGWLASRPGGLDARVGPADGLSGGEAQLLALARVFLRRPGLVILDEPSARLDPATEARLEAAMGHLLTGRTAVIIAHRIDTLERATHLLVLEDGELVEFAARSRLLADPTSRYARLRGAGLAEVLR